MTTRRGKIKNKIIAEAAVGRKRNDMRGWVGVILENFNLNI